MNMEGYKARVEVSDAPLSRVHNFVNWHRHSWGYPALYDDDHPNGESFDAERVFKDMLAADRLLAVSVWSHDQLWRGEMPKLTFTPPSGHRPKTAEPTPGEKIAIAIWDGPVVLSRRMAADRIDQAIAAEREACALSCEVRARHSQGEVEATSAVLRAQAGRIRERGA